MQDVVGGSISLIHTVERLELPARELKLPTDTCEGGFYLATFDLSPFRIRQGTEKDVDVILDLIKGLAEYEKLAHEVAATPQKLRENLFGPKAGAEVVIGYSGDEPVGFALFFPNYSTFLGQPGLYLEDLFVKSTWRNRGLGSQFLRYLAGIAVERGYGRMEWSVLDWNEDAIRFYRKIGARTMDDWKLCRLTGGALQTLAKHNDS